MGSYRYPFSLADPPIAVLEGGGDRCVVRLCGEHDISTEPELRGLLDLAMGLSESAVVVDLGMVKFMDASTLRVIVDASNTLAVSGRGLIVRSAAGPALRLINLCGLHPLIDRCEDARPA